MSAPLKELADYLRSHEKEFVDNWQQTCEADEELDIIGRLTREEFRDGMPQAYQLLCQVLAHDGDAEATKAVETEVAKHGHHRWKQGFSLRALLRDWGSVNRVLVQMIESFFLEHQPDARDARTRAHSLLADFVTESISGSVRRFDEHRQAEAKGLAEDLEVVKRRFDKLTHARGQMLREAAHDIRGGLSSIAGASALLKFSQDEEDADSTVTLDLLDDGVKSVRDLLNSLLDLSRLEAGVESLELLRVDIASLLRQLAAEHQPAAEEKGLDLHAEGPEEMLVETDPEKVRRIVQNLLVNALQHTLSGEVRICWRHEDDLWIVQVGDTGPGIQASGGSPIAQVMNDPHIDPGESSTRQSTSSAGEGIGLSIVKRLCEVLDAGISLESKIGQGSIFTIEFPASYNKTAKQCDDQTA